MINYQSLIHLVTLQAFYTILDNVFYYEPDGMDEFGELYVKEMGMAQL